LGVLVFITDHMHLLIASKFHFVGGRWISRCSNADLVTRSKAVLLVLVCISVRRSFGYLHDERMSIRLYVGRLLHLSDKRN
jgi:hypothetical protein